MGNKRKKPSLRAKILVAKQDKSAEPSLPEVLDGTVTRLTMDADGVSREDVEAVMSATRKKLRRR
jgi:hypothetical protein